MKKVLLAFVASLVAACTHSQNDTAKHVSRRRVARPKARTHSQSDTAKYELVMASEVDWTYLNPARKDKAPGAGTLWGDRESTGATGFLLKPKDGFESPPHTHNVSYRGIVISGFLHNDDPNAANMWMPAGSFWTQPKGHVHTTSATGTDALAYIEIEEGPYLVLPKEDEFDSGERPINVDKSNIVWLDASDIKWIEPKERNGAKVAFLWQDDERALNGSFINFPAGFKGGIRAESPSFKAIVIRGIPKYQAGDSPEQMLETGSYFGSQGKAFHAVQSEASDTLLYVRTKGKYSIDTSAASAAQ